MQGGALQGLYGVDAQVLHCVLYPRLDYDMPILSIDMVGNASTGRVSLAIADPCPASMDRKLPPAYEQTIRRAQLALLWRCSLCTWVLNAAMTLGLRHGGAAGPAHRPLHARRQLQEVHGMESNRSVPEWGKAIFSDLCVIVRPGSAEELERFMLYTIALHQVHILLSKNAGPVTGSRWAPAEWALEAYLVLGSSKIGMRKGHDVDMRLCVKSSHSWARCRSEGERRLEDIRAAHQRYCQKQMENSKTSAVLQAAFTEDFARRYMSEVMFDAPPVVAALNSLE